MKKTFCYILFLCIILSCNKKQNQKKYLYNGEMINVHFMGSKDSMFSGYGGENYPNGNLKSLTLIQNGNIIDTLIYYYENGNVKKKGLVTNNMEYGWWIYNHENGKLNKKVEWFNLGDSINKNQEIYFDSKGEIKIAPSTYFELQIPDTIQIGKNIARIKNYISNANDIDTRFINVIIENKYPEIGKKIDTFTTLTDDSNSPFFGIYGEKVGRKIVQGKIEEQTLKTDTINADSLSLNIVSRYRYFKKEVYVSDNKGKSKLSEKLRVEFKKMVKNN